MTSCCWPSEHFAAASTTTRPGSKLRGRGPRTLLGGPSCSMEQAWAELRLTSFVQELEALPWRTGPNDPADLHQHIVTIAADYRLSAARCARKSVSKLATDMPV